MFEHKSIYHSALVAATSDGPIAVLVTGEPQASKFKDKPAFVGLKIEGKEHLLNLENESIEEQFRGLKGTMIEITAIGRDDTAEVTIHPIAKQGGAPSRQAPRQEPRCQQSQDSNAASPLAHVHGATVGMAINQAVGIIKGFDNDYDYYVSASFSKDLHMIASDIVRVSTLMESGKIAAPVKDRVAPEPPRQPVRETRQPEREPEPAEPEEDFPF